MRKELAEAFQKSEVVARDDDSSKRLALMRKSISDSKNSNWRNHFIDGVFSSYLGVSKGRSKSGQLIKKIRGDEKVGAKQNTV